MKKLTISVSILAVMGLFVGCGDDGGGGQAAAGTPALTPEQCPAAPSDVTLDSLAPVWFGLLVVNATVPSGTADGFEVEVFDPTLGGWTREFGDYWQREDGRYSFSISPGVTEQNKDSEFRVRIRSRLDGCAPSAWVEGPTFTLADPVSDTSWLATWQPGTVSAQISVSALNTMDQTSVTTGLAIDGPMTHTVTFAADGVFDEIFSFTLQNDESGQPFDGCSFTLHYSGSWEFVFSRNSFSVLISDRAPAEDPADGSSCDAPALSTLAINDAMLLPDLALSGTLISTSTDYRGLLSTPEAPVFLENYQLASALQDAAFLPALNYETAAETGTVAGYLGPQYYVYEKQ